MSADMTDEKPPMNEKEPATLQLQVSGEDVKLNIDTPTRDDLDIHDRDPTNMNQHVKVQFTDIFAEPEKEVYSFDKIWILSFKVFTTTKLWCYRITSLILAIPLAVIWGISFACMAFCNNWCYIPCLQSFNIELFCIRRIWEVCLGTFVGPCFEAMGRCCGNMRVRVSKEID